MALLEEGQRIRDTYEVERLLGEGAFAEVYRVRHRFLGRQAMKVFKRVGLKMAELEQLLGEAVLLSRLGHPNIAPVFDANTAETPKGLCGFFTMGMEYVAGGSLHSYWRSHGTRLMPVPTAVELVRQGRTPRRRTTCRPWWRRPAPTCIAPTRSASPGWGWGPPRARSSASPRRSP
jgi:serine/threonine-protein kinase